MPSYASIWSYRRDQCRILSTEYPLGGQSRNVELANEYLMHNKMGKLERAPVAYRDRLEEYPKSRKEKPSQGTVVSDWLAIGQSPFFSVGSLDLGIASTQDP